MRFSVVIVNFNGGEYLQGAVDSLVRQTFHDFEVIIWDNASSDRSIPDLNLSQLENCRVIESKENLGFAAGSNRAAELSSGEWIAMLNPDAVAAPDWLEKMDTAIRAHPGCPMFASTQFNLKDPSILDGVGDSYLAFGFPWRGGFGHDASILPGPGECFSPCGAGAIVHAGDFRELNGFDERLFCYCEDVDLGFRMRLQGGYCLFVPDAVIYHEGGGLAGKQSEFAVYHGTRNRLWVYCSRMPLPLLLVTLPSHVAITLYLLARAGITRRGRYTRQAILDGLAGLWSYCRQATEWPTPKRTVPIMSLARSMAWNPWRMSGLRPHVFPHRGTKAKDD